MGLRRLARTCCGRRSAAVLFCLFVGLRILGGSSRFLPASTKQIAGHRPRHHKRHKNHTAGGGGGGDGGAEAERVRSHGRHLPNEARDQAHRRHHLSEVHSNDSSERDEIELVFVLPGAGRRSARIRLRPDLSGPISTKHILQLAEASSKNPSSQLAGRFEFYRAEKNFLLQGEMSHPSVTLTSSKGPCPASVDGAAIYNKRKCFPHDPKCGCHGPIMERGMVGWAAGRGGGPDFFIYLANGPASHWVHDHTVFGMIEDAESLAAIDAVCDLPVRHDGLTYLKQRLPFSLRFANPNGRVLT